MRTEREAQVAVAIAQHYMGWAAFGLCMQGAQIVERAMREQAEARAHVEAHRRWAEWNRKAMDDYRAP